MIGKLEQKTPTKGMLQSIDRTHTLIFQFNPTTILEKRSVKYHFSEAQGQILPLAQFGMIEPTDIEFELFMHSAGAGSAKDLTKEIQSLRKLTLPKTLSRPEHYQQVSPHKYQLVLGTTFYIGVVNSVEINILQYDKTTLSPIHLTAAISFTAISTSIDTDVTSLKSLTGS
jgi:hypothetical protein